jgi:hypothetical protein
LKQAYELSDTAIDYYFIQDVTSNKTYQDGDEQISILYKNGVVKSISKVENTLITAELLVPIKKHYICYLRK